MTLDREGVAARIAREQADGADAGQVAGERRGHLPIMRRTRLPRAHRAPIRGRDAEPRPGEDSRR